MIALYLVAGLVGALAGVALSVFLGFGWMMGVLAYILGGASGVLLAAGYDFLKAWRAARRYGSGSTVSRAKAGRQPAADSVASDNTSSR
jgi:hypothetical protein